MHSSPAASSSEQILPLHFHLWNHKCANRRTLIVLELLSLAVSRVKLNYPVKEERTRTVGRIVHGVEPFEP